MMPKGPHGSFFKWLLPAIIKCQPKGPLKEQVHTSGVSIQDIQSLGQLSDRIFSKNLGIHTVGYSIAFLS